MKISSQRDIPRQARVAMTPGSAAQRQKISHACLVEAGAGAAAGFSVEALQAARVTASCWTRGRWSKRPT